MTNADQIKSAIDYITILAWDECRYSTELKALAADHARLKAKLDEACVFGQQTRNAYSDAVEEIERLKRENAIYRNVLIDQMRNRGILLDEARSVVEELVAEVSLKVNP